MTNVLIKRGNLNIETDTQRESNMKTQRDSYRIQAMHLYAKEYQELLENTRS